MNYQSLNIDNFDSICRICLMKKQNMRTYSTSQIISMIEECTSIQEPFNIKLPHQICDTCYWQLNVSYQFKQQYVLSVEILCDILESSVKCTEESDIIISIRDKLRKTSNFDKNQLINDSKNMINSLGVPHQLLVETEFNGSNFKTENADESFPNAIETQEDTKNKLNNFFVEEQNDKTNVKKEETNSLDGENNEPFYVLNINSDNHFADKDDDYNSTSSNDTDDNNEQNSEQRALDENDTNSENEKEDSVTNAEQKQQSIADILRNKYKIYDLTCNICNKEMTTRKSLLRHMEIHDKNRKFNYTCHVCKKGFYIRRNFNSHMKRHEGKPKYKCEICPNRFYELIALARHNRDVHDLEPMECRKCSFKFYHPLQLERHEKMHKEAEYKCDVCGKVFDYQYKLKVHQVRHSEVREHTCTICNKGFKHKFTLKTHMKIRHEDPNQRQMCFICGKLFVVGLAAHIETHNKDPIHKCDQCDRVYRTRNGLHIHKEKHNNDPNKKQYTCEICKRSLRTEYSLKKHMELGHSNVRNKICHICNKAFKTKEHLNYHVSGVHMNIRPFNCTVCNKAFHRKEQVQRHMRSHTGERPYSCTICGKAFGYSEVLGRHMESHKK